MFLSDCFSDDSVISTMSDFNNVIVIQGNTEMALAIQTCYSRCYCVLYKGHKRQFEN